MTNEIVAATNEILYLVNPPPVHYWVVKIGGADYGLHEVSGPGTHLVLHNHFIRLPFSAPVAAILLSLIVLLLAGSIFYFVARLRDKGATAAE